MNNRLKFTGSPLDYPRFRSYIVNCIIKNHDIADPMEKLYEIIKLLPENGVHLFDGLECFNYYYNLNRIRHASIDFNNILYIMDRQYGSEILFTVALIYLIDNLTFLKRRPSFISIREHLTAVRLFNNFRHNRWIKTGSYIELLQGTLLGKMAFSHIESIIVNREPSMDKYEQHLIHLRSSKLQAALGSMHVTHALINHRK